MFKLSSSEKTSIENDPDLFSLYAKRYNEGDMHNDVMPLHFSNGSRLDSFGGSCVCGAPYIVDNISFFKVKGFHKNENGYDYYNLEMYRACLDCKTLYKGIFHVYSNDKGGFTIEELLGGKVVKRIIYSTKKEYSIFSIILTIFKKILFPFSK